MKEIFTNISNEIKQGAELVFNGALNTHDPIKMLEILNEYTNACENEDEKEFVSFYFRLKMEQMLNDSDNAER